MFTYRGTLTLGIVVALLTIGAVTSRGEASNLPRVEILTTRATVGEHGWTKIALRCVAMPAVPCEAKLQFTSRSHGTVEPYVFGGHSGPIRLPANSRRTISAQVIGFGMRVLRNRHRLAGRAVVYFDNGDYFRRNVTFQLSTEAHGMRTR